MFLILLLSYALQVPPKDAMGAEPPVLEVEEPVGEAPAPVAPQAHTHWGLVFTGDVEMGPPRDPRLRSEVQYAPVGEAAMIEGDIIIGKVAEIRQWKFFQLVEDVKMTGPEDKLNLTPEERAVIAAVRAVKLPPVYFQEAQVRHTDRARSLLAALLEGESAFRSFPEFPVPQVEQLRLERAHVKDEPAPAPFAIVQADARFRWPQGVIPYVIDPSVPDKAAIQQAIDHWHQKTDRIYLKPWAQSDANYVRFMGGAGCSSYIGKRGGPQPVTLEYGCRVMQIIHEIGHAVGLWHEQCRNDRDSYLAILQQNIAPQMLFNFNKAGVVGRDTGAFDFKSVMLYDRTAFSANGRPTMASRVPAQSGAHWGLGNPAINQLSDGDLAALATMYPLPSNPPNPMHR